MRKKNKLIKLINQDVGIKKIINLMFKNNYKKNNKAVEGGDEVEAQIQINKYKIKNSKKYKMKKKMMRVNGINNL